MTGGGRHARCGGLLVGLWGAIAAGGKAEAQPWVAPESPAPAEAAAGVETEADVPDWMLGTGMASSLFGVGFFVLSAYAATHVGDLGRDDGYERYRSAVPSNESACDMAQNGFEVPGAPSAAQITEMCDEAATWEVVQAVTIPLNVAFGVLGIVLIAKSDTVAGPSKAPVVEPTAQFGPGRGYAGLRVRY